MRPRLPSRPSGSGPVKLAPSWIIQLLSCVDYGMRYPRGDGETILNQPGDILRAPRRGGRAGGKTPYTGTFEVTIKNGLLNVDEGWLNRNGEWLTIPKVTGVAPETGWLCVCSTIENGDWTVPELRIETPSADAFPIAEIEVENDSISVRQLPVAVAMIILAKVCPMAEF